MIPVTKPFLPPYQEYEKYLKEVWSRNWLTNNGPLVNELELKLKKYLGIPHFLFVGNGTIAIQMALQALDIKKGEIITTPFSYVATTSSIAWENYTPVFADIDAETLNINPKEIEKQITENTKAILATHVFGNPCDIEEIETIAKKYKLKVIYDAAHCFNVQYKGKSILNYGDVSTISFHATKIFSTVEGGGIVSQKSEVIKELSIMRNFGHDGPDKFAGIGINGKNSEFHAAMGLCNLKYIDKILIRRKQQFEDYNDILKKLNVKRQLIKKDCSYNYSYYPVIFESESQAIYAKEKLERQNVFPRRYFYPSLNSLPYAIKQKMPVSESISSRILCLPLYHDLTTEEQVMIGRILMRAQNYA